MKKKTLTRARWAAMATALVAAMACTPNASAQNQPQQQRPENRSEQDRQDRGRGGHEHGRGRGRGRGRMDPAQFTERRIAFLTERLQLSTRQQEQIRNIFNAERTQMEQLRPRRDSLQRRDDRPRTEAGRDSVRARFRALHERTEQQIENVLDARQKTAYRELRESLKRDGEHGRRGGETRRPAQGR